MIYDKLKEPDRRKVADFVQSTAGIQLPLSKVTLMETRLRKRQKALGFDSLHRYISYTLDTQEGEVEKVNLLDALTTNKTDFYREPEHFTYLRDFLLRRNHSLSQPVRIWSAGCSAGHEPYTLAMEMLEVKETLQSLRFEIWATDISVTCLKQAKRGVYRHDVITPVPMALRKKYLLRAQNKHDDRVCIAPEVAKHVSFSFFNLLDDDFNPLRHRFDVIFCRNVMIYFGDSDRQYLTDRFCHALKPGGILCIGHSEALLDANEYFQKCKPTVYQTRIQ